MQLDQRKRTVLQGVVWSYVETAEPVGSDNLAQRYSWWGVKSATIRNTLADLADLGYLTQPHTSAGRIPSDRGYRFYVDHLVEFGMADMQAAENAKGALHQERAETLERILKQTCALLTQLTHYTSVATRPRPADTRLRQVIAAPVGDSAILFVALLSSGDSETRLLSGKAALLALEDPLSLTHAVNAFNMQWAAKTIDSIRISLEAQLDVPADLVGGGKRVIYLEFVEAFKQIVASASANGAIMEGAREMFRQPEFHDVEKLDPVFATLQMHPRFVDDIVATPVSGDVAVVIGTENQVEPLHECSVVAAPYLVGTRERGSLGVIGPTRMAYDKVIPTVSYMAKSLTEMLSLIA